MTMTLLAVLFLLIGGEAERGATETIAAADISYSISVTLANGELEATISTKDHPGTLGVRIMPPTQPGQQAIWRAREGASGTKTLTIPCDGCTAAAWWLYGGETPETAVPIAAGTLCATEAKR